MFSFYRDLSSDERLPSPCCWRRCRSRERSILSMPLIVSMISPNRSSIRTTTRYKSLKATQRKLLMQTLGCSSALLKPNQQALRILMKEAVDRMLHHTAFQGGDKHLCLSGPIGVTCISLIKPNCQSRISTPCNVA